MKLYILFFILIFSIFKSNAQNPVSTNVRQIEKDNFTIEEYFDLIRRNHPIAKQAGLLTNDAAARKLAARGGFDPKISGNWSGKDFKDVNYFQFGEVDVKIPTWLGIDLKAAYKTAGGAFLNPAEKLPSLGQGVLGIQAPLLQGMMIDERRANIFSARIFEKSNSNDRVIINNDLLGEAAKTYWEWYFAAKQVKIYETGIVLAKIRLDGLKESFRVGDKPAVDTLEAYIQLQERLFDYNDALVTLRNEALMLSNFLWTENQQPISMSPRVVPTVLLNSPASLLNSADSWLDNHPLLKQYEFKLNQLDVERRLKREKLKPKLNVEYNFLSNSGVDFVTSAILQNYQYGVNFSFPILLRQERGNLELTNIKISNTEFQLQNKRIEILNKINMYRNDFEIVQKQIVLFQSVLKNYQALLDAENQKFGIGESSVFLVNSRERKMIETEIKLLKMEVNQQKIYYGLLQSGAQLR